MKMGADNTRQNSRGMWKSLLLGLVVLSLLLSGCGGQQTKVYRVGILSGLNFFAASADGFKAKMAELGYAEGKNITYDLQVTNIDPAAEEKILQKFVADKVDLIFVFPTEQALLAKAATQGTNIPVVFALAPLEGVDLVKSVREPGGNITGVRLPSPELAARRLEILLQIAPGAKRIFLPYMRGYPTVPAQLEALRPLAEAAGVTLLEAPATNPVELQAALDAQATSADGDVDAILTILEPLGATPDSFAVLGKFATERKLPICGPFTSQDYKVVFDLNVNVVGVGGDAAVLADKILKGTAAGKIPVVSPEQYLQINYKVAQELGLKVPDGVLSMAQEVVR